MKTYIVHGYLFDAYLTVDDRGEVSDTDDQLHWALGRTWNSTRSMLQMRGYNFEPAEENDE